MTEFGELILSLMLFNIVIRERDAQMILSENI